jgi:hypothetical protein
MKTKLIGTGIMLAVLLATMVVGIAAADSASVTASMAVPTGPTCVMSADLASITLGSAPATVNVANIGVSGWAAGNPNAASYMNVYVSGTDWYDWNNGWGFGVGNTYWNSNQGAAYLDGSNTEEPYSALPSGSGWAPITFTATAPGTAIAGMTYHQVITITGSC